VTAALLLVDHWWVRTGIRLSAMDPAAAQYLPPADAVFLAAVLAGCLWMDRHGSAALFWALRVAPCSDSPSR
jgi:hypothetical protein